MMGPSSPLPSPLIACPPLPKLKIRNHDSNHTLARTRIPVQTNRKPGEEPAKARVLLIEIGLSYANGYHPFVPKEQEALRTIS